MPSADPPPRLAQALALGLLQGPAELLPISSSAHTALLPWLAGWRGWAELPAEARKDFEVALHGGAGLALALRLGRELIGGDARTMAPAVGLPAVVGLALEGPIERRLGGPRSIAVGLLAGAVAMVAADRRGGERRDAREAHVGDGVALGLAQVAALAPGLSRNGATLAVARARGFSRAAAQTLSWRVGLPVILGPVLLRAHGVRRRDLAGMGPALAVGAGGAFVSSWAAAGLLRRARFRAIPLWPYALYRCALAALLTVRLRRSK